MGNKKDIGKAYKEYLEGYDSSPHNRVWKKIEAELKKPKRRAFPIWKTITGIGILLLLISSLGIYTYYSNTNSINNNDNNTNQIEHITEEDHIKNDSSTVNSIENPQENAFLLETNSSDSLTEQKTNKFIKSNSTKTAIENQHKSTTNKKATQNNSVNAKIASQDKIATAKNYTTHTNNTNSSNSSNSSNSKSNTTSVVSHKDENSNLRNRFTTNLEPLNASNDSIYLEKFPVVLFDIDGLTKLEREKEKKKKKKKEKNYPLTFSAYVTPTYTNVFGKGSSIDPLLNNKKTVGGFNINYGIATTVEISKKSSLRLSVAISEISYTTKGADTTHTAQNGGFLQYAQGYDNLTINFEASNMIANLFDPNSVIDFEQKYKYLEIPVEYIYNIKNDSKLNTNLVGGLGVLFLLDQSIIAKDRNGNSLEIGKAENLKGTNFSLNLGGNFSYSLSKKLSLDLEPTFKYYLSTFNTKVNSKPYSFGLRLGVSYKL